MVIPDEVIFVLVAMIYGLMIFYIMDLRFIVKQLEEKVSRERKWYEEYRSKFIDMKLKYDELKEEKDG